MAEGKEEETSDDAEASETGATIGEVAAGEEGETEEEEATGEGEEFSGERGKEEGGGPEALSAGGGVMGAEAALRDQKEKVSGPTRDRGGGRRTGGRESVSLVLGGDMQHLQAAPYGSYIIAFPIHHLRLEIPRRHADAAAQPGHVVGKGSPIQNQRIPPRPTMASNP